MGSPGNHIRNASRWADSRSHRAIVTHDAMELPSFQQPETKSLNTARVKLSQMDDARALADWSARRNGKGGDFDAENRRHPGDYDESPVPPPEASYRSTSANSTCHCLLFAARAPTRGSRFVYAALPDARGSPVLNVEL